MASNHNPLKVALDATSNGATSINLRDCHVTANSVKKLISALKSNTTVHTVDLGDNNLGNNGAAAVAQLIETTSTLVELDLHSNGISAAGGAALCTSLAQNRSLQVLNLKGNFIEEATLEEIKMLLKRNVVEEWETNEETGTGSPDGEAPGPTVASTFCFFSCA